MIYIDGIWYYTETNEDIVSIIRTKYNEELADIIEERLRYNEYSF